MRVIICGAGQVGYSIAERLSADMHDVTVIDLSSRLITNVRETLDVRGVVGNGGHPDVLEAAGADQADMLIAVTLYDEVNMIACQVAQTLFGVPTRIARIRAQSYLEGRFNAIFSSEGLPIDIVISPEIEVGETVLRRIALPGALDVLSFSDDNISALAVECSDDCPVLNTPLRQLSELFPDLETTVVAIKREGKMFIARGGSELLTGDVAYLVCNKAKVHRALSLFGHEEQEASRIIIAGGGNIGLYVARAIERRQHRVNVKIIENDKARALDIADQLSHTTILHGSALDGAILEEADIDKADLFVSLTNQDQVNVLSAIMAKRLGCKANMVLINKPVYLEFSRTVGIDAHINPRSVTISKVLQQMRHGRILSVHSVENGLAEIIEAEAMETSPIVGLPIGEIDLPDGVRIGAIYRDQKVLMPLPTTRFRSGDTVVLFAMADEIKNVERLFRVSLEYF